MASFKLASIDYTSDLQTNIAGERGADSCGFLQGNDGAVTRKDEVMKQDLNLTVAQG